MEWEGQQFATHLHLLKKTNKQAATLKIHTIKSWFDAYTTG
jgi:hypothetical protein